MPRPRDVHPPTGPGRESDRGQAVPLMAVVIALSVMVLLAAPRCARPLADAAAARTAADAAALAGAAEGRPAASRMAARNGGELVDFVTFPDGVEVRVRVGSVVARARAESSVEWLPRRRRRSRPMTPWPGSRSRRLGGCTPAGALGCHD